MTRDLCPACHGAGGQRILRRWYEGGEPEYESYNIMQSQQAVILDVPTNERTETEPAEHGLCGCQSPGPLVEVVVKREDES